MKILRLIAVLSVLLFALPATVRADGMADYTEGIRAARSGASFDAIMFFSKAIDSGTLPTNTLVTAHLKRGILWKLVGNKEKAIEDCRKALDLDPGNVEAKTVLRDLRAK